MSPTTTEDKWVERSNAAAPLFAHTGAVFESLFELSSDAIWLYDPESSLLVDCNQAAVELMGAENKRQFLPARPEDISAPFQPGGSRSADRAAQIIATVEKQGTDRFEWLLRRLDGREVPVEGSSTAMPMGGRSIHVVISRDITERKKAEVALLDLNQSLEQRVAERTAALSTSEARLRTVVENAPEAIVVFDGVTGRFLFGNQHACDLYGVPMARLAALTPTDVSPEFQPGGRRSSELAREKVDAALAGGTPVFEWIHRQPNGRLIPTEVRLLRLPAEGQNLIRASIIDNTERKRAERALRESEAKFRALFEGSSHGVVLHDEKGIIEVNPAAVRIMRRQSPQEMIGKHPSDMAPLLQSNGESSVVMGSKHIEECLANGSARFEWLASAPNGEEIPLEVALTRIQWSGREIIQALITDITERRRAQSALAESEARFSAAFQASPICIALSRMSDGCFVLVNDAFVSWSGYAREEILGRNTLALKTWEKPEDRNAFWAELRRTGSIRELECRLLNRSGRSFTMLVSSEVIQLNHVPHMLSMALDITERKRSEAELRASEARLRESEARFSAAFNASPALIGILRVSDGKYVLVNEAHLNWLGYPREEVLGRTCLELGMWENPVERDLLLNDIATLGAVRQKECRWRNRKGELFTILLSAETIQLNNTPHVISMALDITQRKRAEEDLLKTLESEKELSRLKSSFVSMVSHEFRTPLGIIQSSGELLRDFYRKMCPEERDEQLESIIRNTRRMGAMMEEILILSRLDAGKLDFRPAPLDLEIFCRRVVDEVLSATNHRCPIEISLDPALPIARADDRLLGHIFTNLLSNAVKYSETGTPVHLSISSEDPHAVCVIRDQGIGISEDDQAELFTAFHRGANVGNRSGTGLGLVLVKRCVELHHGQVHIESSLGTGTTVTISLPAFKETYEDDPGH